MKLIKAVLFRLVVAPRNSLSNFNRQNMALFHAFEGEAVKEQNLSLFRLAYSDRS